MGRLVDGVQATEGSMTEVVEAPAEPVMVCICTYRRNDALHLLLERLAELSADRYRGWRIGVVVVDDNPDGSARPVAERFAHRFLEGVEYRFIGTGNIATARNLALETGLEAGGWLSLLDDDEVPTDAWLAELVRTQRRTDADFVMGVVRPRYPAGSPAWLADSDFQRTPEYEDETEPPLGFTGNMLVRADWLKTSGHRFHSDWGAGMEDVLFFQQAKDQGARVRYAARALAFEDVPLERTSLRYQLRRNLQGGLAVHDFERAVGHRSRLRLVAAAARRASVAVVTVFQGVVTLRRGRIYKGLTIGARALGIALGALGVARRRGR
jgi:succinoglycan biosynthesis protein ExoM